MLIDLDLFEAARHAKLEGHKLSPALERLRLWLNETYGVDVVHMALEHVRLGFPRTRPRPRLTIVVETDQQCRRLSPLRTSSATRIKRRILDACKTFPEPQAEKLASAFVLVSSFEEACIARATSRFLVRAAGRLTTQLATLPIWRIDSLNLEGFAHGLFVFLRTDEDVRNARKNGVASRIRRECLEAIRRYDEFGYVSARKLKLSFDSKENLDAHYLGSTGVYWRWK